MPIFLFFKTLIATAEGGLLPKTHKIQPVSGIPVQIGLHSGMTGKVKFFPLWNSTCNNPILSVIPAEAGIQGR